MNVLVTGASGFIGRALSARLEQGGHRVVPLRRAPDGGGQAGPAWNPDAGEARLEAAGALDAVVHLAGETIAQRWTRAAKARIRASRVDATRLLCEALARLPRPPRALICASATGFYGDRGQEALDERSGPGTGFLAELCQAWEAASEPARRAGLRVVHLRLGIVLARHGGALAKMLPAFRLGLGGRLGTGRQFWSWIALEDALRVVELALVENTVTGPVNVVAPAPLTNAEFARALAQALRRPACLPVPSVVVRLAFGEMGREALLASARVTPARLLESGFAFRFSDLDTALPHLLTVPVPTA